MTEAAFSKRIAFVYLTDLQERFLKQISREQIEKAITYSLNSIFSDTIKTRMVDI